LFRSAQGAAIKVKKLEPKSGAEKKMKDNVTSKIALQLQELSTVFRKKQQEYLTNVRRIEKRGVKDAFSPDLDDDDLADFHDQGFTAQQMAMADNISATVSQREKEIIAVAKSIEELATLFKDLSLLIVEQGTILDRIDYNCQQTEINTAAAVKELQGANESQKKQRSKLCMLVLCVLILIAIVAVIVKATK
jgi:syntaxin 16